jgi:HEAT repeat protein
MASESVDSGSDLALPSRFFEQPPGIRRRHVDRLVQRTPSGAHGREMIATWYEGGDPKLLTTFSALVERDPDGDVKRAAIQGLARIPDPAARFGLMKGLALPDRRTRYMAAEALGRLRSREAVPMLVSLLDDSYCRVAAAQALVAIRDERALESLRAAAAQAGPWRRRRLRRVVSALETELGYPSAN